MYVYVNIFQSSKTSKCIWMYTVHTVCPWFAIKIGILVKNFSLYTKKKSLWKCLLLLKINLSNQKFYFCKIEELK